MQQIKFCRQNLCGWTCDHLLCELRACVARLLIPSCETAETEFILLMVKEGGWLQTCKLRNEAEAVASALHVQSPPLALASGPINT